MCLSFLQENSAAAVVSHVAHVCRATVFWVSLSGASDLQLLGEGLALVGRGVQGVPQKALHIQERLIPLGCEGLTGPLRGEGLVLQGTGGLLV